ncbi:hypothetical protein SLEP1_g3024 [Rubroshorea leprosula]|uniref:RRM domain-containing protein n=1 Tax=Rubroshorea leprosula TaxID=152421 RepID=A0AAV5HTM3_9ROSI|nr:hypothetical protein SLEP1_g3024 [Rubroshorea leprosula]
MRTKDGKSRQFAFVGFQTEHEAEEGIKYFNKSYLDTFRITCESMCVSSDAQTTYAKRDACMLRNIEFRKIMMELGM